jgi:hypothetical protein
MAGSSYCEPAPAFAVNPFWPGNPVILRWEIKNMKTLKTVLLAAVLLGLGLAGRAVLHTKKVSEPWRAGLSGNGFAVVELFTSEGCSSCPPADALIAQVQQEDKNLPVYILAFHVDYWNRLGWKDAFSDAAYSDRQRQYATWLNLSSIYTPQVVVNGRQEFVGSESGALHAAIQSGLEQQGNVQLTLTGLKLDAGRLDWQCRTEGLVPNARVSVVVAIVERSATTAVKAGENNGRTLSHVQIVRQLGMGALDGKGNAEGKVEWPAGIAPGEGEVIAFLQDQDNGKIIAATKAQK